jgi:hypothetical protein
METVLPQGRTLVRVAQGARAVAAALAPLLATDALAAVRCVNTTGAGGCSKTIQGAITLAAAGDSIVIAPGVYTESAGIVVPIDKSGLRISGPQTAILDPSSRVGSTANTLRVDAANVSVTGLTFRNSGKSAIVVSGAGFRLSASRITATQASCVSLLSGAEDATLRSNTIERCLTSALTFSAQNVKLLSNTISYIGAQAIAGSGDGFMATGNTIQNVRGHGVYLLGGDGAIVQRNTLIRVGGAGDPFGADGIHLNGANASVAFNTLTLIGGYGIDVSGAGATVASNTVRHALAVAIFVSGDGATIARNSVSDGADDGIDAYGNETTVSYNKITLPADGDGIYLGGNGLHVVNNTVGGGHDGIYLLGDQPTVTGNSVRDASDVGIWTLCETYPELPTSQCTGGTIGLNRASDVGVGIAVVARSQSGALDVVNNSVTGAKYSCFGVENNVGTDNASTLTTKGNRATTCGFAASSDPVSGFEIFGIGHAVSLNSASGAAGDGFLLAMLNSTVTSNTSLLARRNAFEVIGGGAISLTGNRAGSFGASGFALGAGVGSVTLDGNIVVSPGVVGLCYASGVTPTDNGNTFVSVVTTPPTDCTSTYGY